MYINYDIASIVEEKDNVIVEARFFEGDYEDLEQENEDGNKFIEKRYVRKNHLYDMKKYFEAGTTKEDWAKWFTEFMNKDAERKALW